uniref:Uncharacterized protein n=1 Tax=Acrobeloides nanus TaxID=290746 RepID=A0A914DC00_9BILA
MENKPKKPQIEKFTICALGAGNEVEIEPIANKFNFKTLKSSMMQSLSSSSKQEDSETTSWTNKQNLLADLEPLDEHFLETTSLKQLLLEYKQLNLVPSQSTSQDKQEDEGYEYYLAGSPDSPTLCKRKKLIIKDDITLENINPHFEKLKTEVAKLAQIPKEFKPSLYPSVMGSDPESDEKAKDLVKEKEDQR